MTWGGATTADIYGALYQPMSESIAIATPNKAGIDIGEDFECAY